MMKTLDTLKKQWVMKTAHSRAKNTKEEFNNYRHALSHAMKIMWRVVKGEMMTREEEELAKDYQEYVNGFFRYIDLMSQNEEIKKAS